MKPDIDPWDLAQKPGYHLEEFYCRATDGHGHSEAMNLKLSPGVTGQIAAIVASGKLPTYRTPQDFARDAIVHRLKYVGELMKLEKVLGVVDLNVTLSKIDVLRRYRMEQEAVVIQFRDECEAAVDRGDLRHLDELLNLGQDAAEGLKSGYLDEMTEHLDRYGRVASRMRSAADARFEMELRTLTEES